MARFLSSATESKIALFEALCSLLKTKGIDEITVKNLCATAGVGKTTFYTHFRDKYEIMQWYSDLAHEVGVGQIGLTLTWEEGHRITSEALFSEADSLRRAASSKDYNSINPQALRWREESLTRIITEFKHIPMTSRLQLQITGLAAAELAVASRFFAAPTRGSVDEYVGTMISIVPQELYELLKDPVDPARVDPTLEQMRMELAVLQGRRAQNAHAAQEA